MAIMGSKAPDEVGTREGWRAFRLRVDFDEKHPVRLLSPQQKVGGGRGGPIFWPPREPMVAKCHGKYDATDPPPHKDHMCGLYSTKTLEDLYTVGNYHMYNGEHDGFYCVVGRVENWGRYEPGSIGWRAEKCYPQELFIPYEVAMHEGQVNYNGRVITVPFWKALVAEYRVKIVLKNLLEDQFTYDTGQPESAEDEDRWYG